MVGVSCQREASPEPSYTFDYRLGEGVGAEEAFPPGMVLFLDAFETPDSVVRRLRAQGVEVIGYISVGTWEAWRPDTGLLPPALRGKPYPGWPGEYFEVDAAALPTFTRRGLQLQSGDWLYFSSDGFPDQIGGPRQRKFGYKAFRGLLAELSRLPASLQAQRLAETLAEWRGPAPQVDDVLVVGIQVP